MSNCTEYQHFIPQFLVKNYAYPFSCPKVEDGGKKRKCKCKHEKGKYPGDLVINMIDVSNTPFQQGVTSVKRIFGAPGMYHDPSRAATGEHRRIEDMFGKMESQASTIFCRIVKSHDSGDTTVMLTRTERDLIRKFIFLLKYRGSGYHRRFYHKNPEDYCDDDRERLLVYMRKHGFSTPLDVWFHNLEAIMALKIDSRRDWMDEIRGEMFPDDAEGFILHIQGHYMAICTPAEPEQEFLLTENCYNIHEGPSSLVKDCASGQVVGGTWAEFHYFAPISPRLMLVLRSFVLPSPEEGANPVLKKQCQDIFWLSFGQVFGLGCTSLLEDLPVKKARNSYSSVVHGCLVPNPGHDGEYRPSDKFFFKYHPISSGHVQTMNNIFLENAHSIKTIAFRDRKAFFNTLEAYISSSCEHWKNIGADNQHARYLFLQGLETLAKSMGSQKHLVWKRLPLSNVTSYNGVIGMELKFRGLMDSVKKAKVTGENHPVLMFTDLYSKLGSESRLYNDIAQAGRMLLFEDVVNAWGVGRGEMIRFRNQLFISEIFKASRSARYWLYLKLLRKSRLYSFGGTQDIVDLFANDHIREGPEDAFAKTSSFIDAGILNELMDITVRNHILMQEGQVENLWSNSSTDMQGASRDALLQNIRFFGCSICNCGIPKIEMFADSEMRKLRRQGACHQFSMFTCADQEKNLELMTRVHVRSQFCGIMAGEAEARTLKELELVFFSLTFPTPPVEL